LTLHTVVSLTQSELTDLLLHVAPVRPVFVWGPPGIGKSSIIAAFSRSVGLECVTLLGSQLAPEDLIGVPRIDGNVSRFCPPSLIVREEPFCLFLDELNLAGDEVKKAFYSLIQEQRLGEYHLPPGSIVIGAGNRAQDTALVRPLPSALINRHVHIQLKVSVREWLQWAYANALHPWVCGFIEQRPDALQVDPPKTEEPFSTPRSWHMLSDALGEYREADLSPRWIEALAFGCVTAEHARLFVGYVKQLKGKYQLRHILSGEAKWPRRPEEQDELYYLVQALRGRLVKELPAEREQLTETGRDLAFQAKARLKELAEVKLEYAQLVVSGTDRDHMPDWFLVDVVKDLPRLAARKG
jgi:hypothetical protein